MLDINIYAALFFESTGVFMSMFFFIQYSILKRKEHLYYALYLLSISIYYLLAVPGLFFHIDASDYGKLFYFDLFKRPVQFIISIFYTFFIIFYLGLKLKSGYLYRFFKVLIGLYLVLSVICFFLNLLHISYSNEYYIFNLVLFPLQFYIVIALFKHKVAYSKYIICGTIIILTGSCITLGISMYGATYAISSLTHSIHVFLPAQISILMDMFLFSIALQKKIADNEKSLIDAAFQKQQAVLLERERIIADLHDDVGGGLSSIRMMSDLMVQQNNPSVQGKAATFALRISQTAKDIAQRMHTIIWSLNAENDTLGNFLEYVRQYGVSFFEDSGISFQFITVDALPGDIQLKGVQRKNLFLIVKEAFHNILKHSGATTAIVQINIRKNYLFIEITDNGKGINNENHIGNGLKNMKKRMEEIGGKMETSSSHGLSIKIEVKII